MRVQLRRAQLVVVLSILTVAAVPATTETVFPLIEATRQEDTEQVRRTLIAKADVNVRQGDGSSALHWAAYKGNLEITDLLLSAGAKANVANDLGATPLWLAASNGNATIVARLLQAGADPNLPLGSGETPLMSAARSGGVEAVRDLLRHGANVNAKEHFRGQTALMWAVEQDHPEVAHVLLASGADIRARSNVWQQLENTGGNTSKMGHLEMAQGGSTAILIAARRGGTEIAQVLLDAGADVNDATATGTSALVLAAHSGNGRFAEYLLGRGADVNADGAGYTALHAAVLRGNVGLVKALLDKGANVNAPVQHGTPGRRFSADYSLRHQWIGANALWLASQFGEVEMMRLLLEKGADPLVKTEDGTTTLLAAMSAVRVDVDRRNRYSYEEVDLVRDDRVTLEEARLLASNGVDVNTANTAGDTALHLASRLLFDSVIKFLAEETGADVNARNAAKRTPLKALLETREVGADDARLKARERTVALLRQLGATE